MHSEPFIVDKIIKEIKPEGLISKSDINFELFPTICKKIIDGDMFQSNTIIKSQRELFKRNINWDNHDNEILILISEGIKTINLPSYIPLSMSAIEKRKANINIKKAKQVYIDLNTHNVYDAKTIKTSNPIIIGKIKDNKLVK